MHLGAEICQETVDAVIATDGQVPSQPQAEEGELHAAPKIFKETCEIDWTLTAKRVHDFVRGLSPYPGTWSHLADTADHIAVLKIFKTLQTGRHTDAAPGTLSTEHGHLYVATADEWLEILELQAPGKKRMAARDYLNGNKDMDNCRLVRSQEREA